jgi:TatD DNase family protein
MESFRLLDTHAHLHDEAFKDDLNLVIDRCQEANMSGVINAGTDVNTSRQAAALAGRTPWLWALAGVHPHDAKTWDEQTQAELESLWRHPRVLGVGEIGLDYHYDFSPRDVQQRVFARQWQLAAELGLPAIIHLREAFDDFFTCIDSLPRPPHVMLHCFSGDLDIARRALDLGCHFSIGGALTFPKNEAARQVFANLPVDVLHLETDCPYLAPVPMRGKRSEPRMVRTVFDFLARLRRENPDTLCRTLQKNAVTFFGPRLEVC